MQEVLKQLGLNDKESTTYLILLEEGLLTAAELSKHAHETRTNTYMILESLEKHGLVAQDDTQAVRRFRASDPVLLRQLLVSKQAELKQAQAGLGRVMPKLRSLYTLNELKPGVVYLEGLDGFKTLLDDMARAKNEALIIPSWNTVDNKDAYRVLEGGLRKRAKLGVPSRIIFHDAARKHINLERFKRLNIEVKFWGSREYPGELVVYGDKCAFSTFNPHVVNTILTDPVIAETLRSLFEELWGNARS